MPNEVLGEVPAVPANTDVDSSFASGFSDDEVPGETPATEATTETTATEATPATETPAAKPEPFVFSKELFDQMQERINSLSHTSEDVRKAHGNIGELKRAQGELKALVEAVKSSMTQGGPKLSSLQFKRLSQEFPEMAKLLSEDLNDQATPATESAMPPAAIGAEQVKKVVDEAVTQVKAEYTTVAQKQERKLLTLMHSDWEKVVTSPEFQQWIATRPERAEFADSWESDFVSKVLTTYKGEAKAKADAAAKAAADKAKADAEALARSRSTTGKKTRLEAAVTPQGVATQGAPQLSENDHFRAGFTTG